MISSCHRCTLLGFTASALLHFGAVSAILWTGKTQKASFHPEHQVAVSLAMFEGPVGLDPRAADVTPIGGPSPTPEPASGPEPMPESEPVREPEPAPEQEIEPERETEPGPDPAPEPTPVPASAPQRVPEPDLQANPAPKPKSKPAPRPKPKPKPESKRKPTGKTLSRPSHASERSGKPSAKAPSGRAAASAKSGGKKNGAKAKALEKQYLVGLQRAIAKKRRYPSQARRRGETGVVRVSFVLAQSGRISGARVDKSSGSRALDKAALETLKRLGRYKPIPKAIGRTRWQLRVPIRFALE